MRSRTARQMTEPARRATQIPPYPVQRAGRLPPPAPDNKYSAALPSGENATRPPQQNGEGSAPNQSGQGMPQNGGGMLPNRGEAGAAMESLPSQEQEPSSSESTEVSGAENDSGAAESSAWNGGNAGRQGGKPAGRCRAVRICRREVQDRLLFQPKAGFLLGGCLLLIALAVFAAAKYRR